MYGGILEHFGIDVEVRHVRAFSQCAQHGVGTAAHAALQVEEGGRNLAVLQVFQQERGHVVADLRGDGVWVFEGAGFVGDVAFDDSLDAVGIHFHVGFAYPVVGLRDHDGGAIGVVFYLIYVMDAHAFLAVEGIQLDEDAFPGKPAHGGADAAGCREINVCLVAYQLHFAGLDDGPVHMPQVALADLGSHVGQVEVGIGNLVVIDVCAEVFVRRVGCAEFDGMHVGQHAVAALSCGSSRQDVDFELSSCGMFCFCLFGDFRRYALRYTGRRESAQPDGISVLDEGGRLGSRDFVKSHKVDSFNRVIHS